MPVLLCTINDDGDGDLERLYLFKTRIWNNTKRKKKLHCYANTSATDHLLCGCH